MSRRATLSVRLLAVGATAAALALPTRRRGSRLESVTAAGINVAPGSELTETTRLADRRSLVVGDRAYAMSTADTLYPAAAGTSAARWAGSGRRRSSSSTASGSGWPTRGSATRTAPGHPDDSGLGLHPHRLRQCRPGCGAAHRLRPRRHPRHLVGLTLTSPQARTVPVAMDAHSELMSSYPWGWTTPNAGTFNLPDTGSYAGGALVFRDTGTPPVANADRHDWAALVAGNRTPSSHELGPDHRGPQDPAWSVPPTAPRPPRATTVRSARDRWPAALAGPA
jgi:hypothetical protein